MNCLDAEPLLGACLDAELEPQTSLEIERHLSGCDRCAHLYRKLELLRDEIAAAEPDWSIDADLRPLRAAIRRRHRPSRWPRYTLAIAASVFVVALLLPGNFPLQTGGMERQLVDSHVRSLMADHLVDVPSSDRHTVKPWFQGKLNFSPSVPDLTADGFVLAGGRLDVIASHPAAALIYKRQSHIINLWISPADAAERVPSSSELDGYHLVRWQHGGMAYQAVSDLNPVELRQFADLFRTR